MDQYSIRNAMSVMSVTNSCLLQLLARLVGCRQDTHFLRQFECRLKLRFCFILAAFPPSDGTEAEVALHREWSHAELVGDRGGGAIMPGRRRCVCRVAGHGEIAEQMFQPRHRCLLAPRTLQFGGFRAPPLRSRRSGRSQDPIAASKKCLSRQEGEAPWLGTDCLAKRAGFFYLSGSGISVNQTRDHHMDA